MSALVTWQTEEVLDIFKTHQHITGDNVIWFICICYKYMWIFKYKKAFRTFSFYLWFFIYMSFQTTNKIARTKLSGKGESINW